MAADKRRRRGTAGRRKIWIAAVAVFVVVDVALVGLALSEQGSDGGTASVAPVATTSSSPTATPTPLPDLEPLTSPAGYLSAIDASTAYRINAGDCAAGEAPNLEKSIDSGVSWVSNPVTTTLRSVTQFAATSDTYAYMVGLNDACEANFTATYTSGTGFGSYPDELLGVWYLNTADGTLHSPAGVQTAPCSDVVDVVGLDRLSAAVICSDRTFFHTSDGGGTWGTPSPLAGAMATSTGVGGYVVAQIGRDGCAGVQVSTLSAADLTPAVLGCYESTPDSLEGADIRVSGTQDSIWLQVADTVVVSTDGGATWA
ncbi:hypothetical protein [Frigoribacterium sp. CFBP9030]|uniref:hypothetical protein n=1 Tax=Frigoribacterium sp. CFBP9030 TaxID=3096537 RepID=UPI002A69A917|nr:hypothetical protein [Frigoribacterium sp. CFBP9030]MDY0892253.1 hypothetical protein [Frigoribacterium sp. CFBP9030]